MVLIMAKEIKVTFDNGGVYEGFANTYTLNDSITYYFSFDLDYRVQISNNVITLQEYRNAGAWYPIDIITKFEIAEISGAGDEIKQWVQDNFVLKSGDTMTGALKFDFGNGVVFRIEPQTNRKRVQVTGNGAFYWENDDKKRTFSIVSYDAAVAVNFYKVDNKTGGIWFRNNESGNTSNDYRVISFYGLVNNSSTTAMVLGGQFKTDNVWFFNGETHFKSNSYWQSDNVINAQISTYGDMQLFNGKQIYIRKNARGASNDHFTTFKYNGQDTISNIGGEDARYRVTGYNNFANSIECYDKITIKTENQSTAMLILSKGYLTTYDNSNDRRINIDTGVAVYGANDTLQYLMRGARFDIYNGNAIICHNGSGGGGTNDVQATFQYNGIRAYNYNGLTFSVNIANGYYSNTSKRFDITGNYVTILASQASGMNLTAPNGNVIISDSKGVYGRSSNTENNTYITNNTENVYVQTSQTIPSDTRRDELAALLDLFQIVYNILDAAGLKGASEIAEYTSDIVMWIYDNQDGVLKPVVTKIQNLSHS